MRQYIPIGLLLLLAAALPGIAWKLSALLAPHAPSAAKNSTYECGITPKTEARDKLSVHYYLIAVLFLVFDVETVFLMPWAIQAKELGRFGLIEMGVFLFLLLFGYGYLWSKGALKWQ